MKKLLTVLAALAVMFVALAGSAVADTANIEYTSVEINGHDVDFDELGATTTILSVEEGELLEIEVGVTALAAAADVEVSAEISGYEYDDYESLEDQTHLFDMDEFTTKFVDLEIALPDKLDDDTYYLRIRMDDKASLTKEVIVQLSVEPSRNSMDISDLVLSTSTVEAGRSVLATVEVENNGDGDQKDVKVTVAVPALGISASDFIDNVEADWERTEYETSEELFLSIPDCAAAGVYELVVTAKYDEYESTSESYALTVTKGRYCESSTEDSKERLVIAVGPESQGVSQGQTATYAVALSNEGDETETFTLQASAAQGTASLSESLVVLGAGESKVVYGYVATQDAAGLVPVTLSVASEGQTLETIGLTVDVEDSSSASSSLRSALEIALIVLVVLLVLVGLVIGFTRLRKDEDEEQTYY